MIGPWRFVHYIWINGLILSIVILEECQDKQKCHLVASTKTFLQDPCPGTRKYLEVAYKCRPNEFASETVCEGEQLELRCSKSTRIAISTGMFGRTTIGDSKCPELLRNTSALQSTCYAKDTVEVLHKECHGRKRCTIEAEEYMFGNPCPKGVNKYLNVVYTCVPKRVLLPTRRHNHRKHKKNKTEDKPASNNSSQYIPSGVTTTPSFNKILPRTTQKPEQAENFPAGKTTPCVNESKSSDYRRPSPTGLLTNWLNAFNFIRKNSEKAILYMVLGVAFGVISLLFLVIIRLAIINKRRSRAKLDITEPTHEDTPAPSNHIEAPTLERSDSVDRIEVVRFNPMRSRDFATCTLRSDIGNRSLTNYYG